MTGPNEICWDRRGAFRVNQFLGIGPTLSRQEDGPLRPGRGGRTLDWCCRPKGWRRRPQHRERYSKFEFADALEAALECQRGTCCLAMLKVVKGDVSRSGKLGETLFELFHGCCRQHRLDDRSFNPWVRVGARLSGGRQRWKKCVTASKLALVCSRREGFIMQVVAPHRVPSDTVVTHTTAGRRQQ